VTDYMFDKTEPSKRRISVLPGKVGRQSGNWDGYSRLSAAVMSNSFYEIRRLYRSALKKGCPKKLRKTLMQEADEIIKHLKNPLNPFVEYLCCNGHGIDDEMIDKSVQLIREEIEKGN